MENFKKGFTIGKILVISSLLLPILFYIIFDNFIQKTEDNYTARIMTYAGLGIYLIIIGFFISYGRKFLFADIYIKDNNIFVSYFKKIIRQTHISEIKQIALINGFIYLCTDAYEISKKNQKKLYGEIYFIVDFDRLRCLLSLVESNTKIIYKTPNKSDDELTKLFTPKCT